MESSVSVHALLILLAIFCTGLSELFVDSAAGQLDIFGGLFHTTTQNVSETYSIEASLDGWAGSTWILLNVWTAGWLLYALSTVIRRNIFGPICCNPEIHPPYHYCFWIIINISRICWVFLWDRQYLFVALVVKIAMPICSYFMLFDSYRSLHLHSTWLTINNPNERWCIRFMTQNGLALFGTWTCLEALINVGVVLKYRAGQQDPLVSMIVLTLILVWLCHWFIFESYVFKRYILYTFTVYPVVILGLGAIFTHSYSFDGLRPTSIYCGFLMIVATVLNSIRLIAVCFYKKSKPPVLSLPPFPPAYTEETEYKVKVQDITGVQSGAVNNQFSEN